MMQAEGKLEFSPTGGRRAGRPTPGLAPAGSLAATQEDSHLGGQRVGSWVLPIHSLQARHGGHFSLSDELPTGGSRVVAQGVWDSGWLLHHLSCREQAMGPPWSPKTSLQLTPTPCCPRPAHRERSGSPCHLG